MFHSFAVATQQNAHHRSDHVTTSVDTFRSPEI